jgi:hypothetical protein
MLSIVVQWTVYEAGLVDGISRQKDRSAEHADFQQTVLQCVLRELDGCALWSATNASYDLRLR